MNISLSCCVLGPNLLVACASYALIRKFREASGVIGDKPSYAWAILALRHVFIALFVVGAVRMAAEIHLKESYFLRFVAIGAEMFAYVCSYFPCLRTC